MSLRNAATVLITVPKQCKWGFNYGVVMLRRTGKANYVFPGGVLESADASLAELFTPSELTKLTPPPSAIRSPVFEGRDFALRVAGIRETFEESGILLLEKNNRWISGDEMPEKVSLN